MFVQYFFTFICWFTKAGNFDNFQFPHSTTCLQLSSLFSSCSPHGSLDNILTLQLSLLFLLQLLPTRNPKHDSRFGHRPQSSQRFIATIPSKGSVIVMSNGSYMSSFESLLSSNCNVFIFALCPAPVWTAPPSPPPLTSPFSFSWISILLLSSLAPRGKPGGVVSTGDASDGQFFYRRCKELTDHSVLRFLLHLIPLALQLHSFHFIVCLQFCKLPFSIAVASIFATSNRIFY